MATPQDADLIMKLYQLRTEPLMREARTFMVVTFNPASFEELQALQRNLGSRENNFYRQVLGYWEMAAAFVLRDALDADLFLDCNGEPFLLYAKFTPFFEAYAKAFGQPFMPQMTRLIESHPAMQARYTMMLAMLEAGRKQAAPVELAE